jgi:diaminohydroxyphosphoribosylaminopyrimidine deaminase/5-amino-6-(5-phosphoribosylamino)uracil reductase
LIVYMAPVLLGERARPLLGLPFVFMSENVNLDIKDTRKVGNDWRFTIIPA